MTKFNFNTKYYHLPVSDIKIALDFFQGVMGFELRYENVETTKEQLENEDISTLQWLEFDGNGLTLLVQYVPNVEGRIDTGIGFDVPEWEPAYNHLKSKGVELFDVFDTPGGKSVFYFRDPFGNSFAVFGK